MSRRALATLTLLVACGGRTTLRDEVADAGDPCPALAAAFCARLLGCAPAALSFGIDGHAIGADRCVERVTLACDGWRATPDLAASRAQVAACEREVTAASCAEVGTRFLIEGPFCDAWPRGHRAGGAVCQSSAQCASGWCHLGAHCTPDGRCDGVVHSPCEVGWCGDVACGECAFPAPVTVTARSGERCDGSGACAAWWQRCVGGVCVDRPGEGAPCSLWRECAGSWLICDRAVNRCVRRQVSAAGAICGGAVCGCEAGEPATVCGTGYTCTRATEAALTTCQGLIEDGADCAASPGRCTYPARCLSGRCVLPAGVVCGP